jgi:20S proteasome subunit beta 6
VAGLDKNGKGVVYGYDAIGSYGSDKALAQGTGAHMILPYLDSEVTGYNNPNHSLKPALTIDKALELV